MSERKLVGTQEMFAKALAGGYAIGAYNVNNMEILQAIAEAAEETRSPIILQVSAGARKYANQTYLIKLVEAALATTTVPIALHLDHGADFEICKACIDGGFSSVMIDGSRFSFEENVEVTKKVVEYAHERGVSVEAELGKLAGIEDDVNVDAKDAKYTNVKEAVDPDWRIAHYPAWLPRCGSRTPRPQRIWPRAYWPRCTAPRSRSPPS